MGRWEGENILLCLSFSIREERGAQCSLSATLCCPGAGFGEPLGTEAVRKAGSSGGLWLLLSPISIWVLPMLPLQAGTFPVMSGAAEDSSSLSRPRVR